MWRRPTRMAAATIALAAPSRAACTIVCSNSQPAHPRYPDTLLMHSARAPRPLLSIRRTRVLVEFANGSLRSASCQRYANRRTCSVVRLSRKSPSRDSSVSGFGTGRVPDGQGLRRPLQRQPVVLGYWRSRRRAWDAFPTSCHRDASSGRSRSLVADCQREYIPCSRFTHNTTPTRSGGRPVTLTRATDRTSAGEPHRDGRATWVCSTGSGSCSPRRPRPARCASSASRFSAAPPVVTPSARSAVRRSRTRS
jgi:hypothetical protein